MLPAVGSRRRVIRRPVVDLPQPDSPTRPRLSPSATWKSSPSTAWTAPTVRRIGKPPLTGKCLVRPETSRRGLVLLMVVKSRLVTSVGPSGGVLGEELALLPRAEVTGRTAPVHDLQCRLLRGAQPARHLLREGAPRVEAAARRRVQQRGRCTRDG